ncbi:MAG: hypothetical protein Q4A29_06115 [Eubacteriales bacterium]|nr:hypothetical protein [Eubacteriales bacterium]
MNRMRKKMKSLIYRAFPEKRKEILYLLLFFPVLWIAVMLSEENLEVKKLKRPAFLEEQKSLSLSFEAEEEADLKGSVRLDLGLRAEKPESIQEKLDKMTEVFAAEVLERKKDRKIRAAPWLPNHWQGMEVTYRIEPEKAFLKNGDWNYFELFESEKSQEIEIEASLMYEERIANAKVRWIVRAEDFDRDYIKKLLQKEVESDLDLLSVQKGEELVLPAQLHGKRIRWTSYRNSVSNGQMLVYYLILATLLAILSQISKKEKEKRFQKEFRKDFNYMLHQLVLLLKSGKSPYNAFSSVCQNVSGYGRAFTELMQENYQKLYHQEPLTGILSGFYQRCPIREIYLFEQLFMMAYEKGDAWSILYLEQLRDEMFSERLRQAREYTEKTTARLIFPMLIYLIIIVIMTIFPAFEQGI